MGPFQKAMNLVAVLVLPVWRVWVLIRGSGLPLPR
jgi:hypothetical protein